MLRYPGDGEVVICSAVRTPFSRFGGIAAQLFKHRSGSLGFKRGGCAGAAGSPAG